MSRKGGEGGEGIRHYRAFVNGRREGITLADSWAHVRRKLYEASEPRRQ